MAGNNDLYKAYSILGSATTAEYKRRRKEEEEARRTARRQARQDRMMAYFTAPILQSAGKAVAGGVGDLVGSMVLGENAKNYFNTEQGIIAARNSKYVDKKEKELLRQRTQFTTEGRTEVEGQTDFLKKRLRVELEEKYGKENSAIIDQFMRENSSELQTKAAKIVEDRDSLITQAGLKPDISDFKARLKDKEGFYGQDTGVKVFQKLVGKITGKKPAEAGAMYILTGSTDPTEAQRERAGELMNPKYIAGLAQELEKLSVAGSGTVENAVLTFAQKNPGVLEKLKEGAALETQEAIKAMDYGRDAINALKSKRAASDPGYVSFISKNKDNYRDIDSLNSAYNQKISGISKENKENFTSLMVATSTFKDTTTKLERAIARNLYSLDNKDIDTVAELKDNDDYAKIQKDAKAFISDVLMPSFSTDLGIAISQMSDEQKTGLVQPGVKAQLAMEYASFQVNNNLKTLTKVNFFKNEQQEVSVLADPKAGVSFLLKSSDNIKKIDGLVDKAVGTGADKFEERSSRELIQPFSTNIQAPAFKDQFSFVADPRISREDRASLLAKGVKTLTQQLQEKAISEGYKNPDGSANLSVPLMEQLEEFEKELYSQIYPENR